VVVVWSFLPIIIPLQVILFYIYLGCGNKLNDLQLLHDRQKSSLQNIESAQMEISSLLNNEGQTQRRLLAKMLKYNPIYIVQSYGDAYFVQGQLFYKSSLQEDYKSYHQKGQY
jgi:hypothetical protein